MNAEAGSTVKTTTCYMCACGQLLKVQADFGGFYNANGAKLILAEVQREHGQAKEVALKCRISSWASPPRFEWKRIRFQPKPARCRQRLLAVFIALFQRDGPSAQALL